jgi:hypothetical protein
MRYLRLGKKVAVVAQALVLACSFGVASVATVTVGAGTALADACTGTPDSNNPIAAGSACAKANGTSNNLFAQGGVFQTIANTLIFIVGAVAVIFLIIGGLRYVISNGDPKNVSAAKDTILYAIVGIVVAIVSFALVSFVINALQKAS